MLKLFANLLCISSLFQIEPCDDFYNFMCGGFIERTILPAGEGQTSYFHQGGLEVRNEIRYMSDSKVKNIVKELFEKALYWTVFDM